MLDRHLSFQELFSAAHEWPNPEMQYIGSDEGSSGIWVDQGASSDGVYIGKYYFEKLMSVDIGDSKRCGLVGYLAGGLIKVYMCFECTTDAYRSLTAMMRGPIVEYGQWILRISNVDFEEVDHDDEHAALLKFPVLVIDLETLHVSADSVVTEIGGVFGDLLENRVVKSFYRIVAPESQPGRKATMDTTMWHEDNNGDNAILRYIALNNCGESAMSAFSQLWRFVDTLRKKYPKLQVITNGPEFDAAVCQSMYEQLGAKFPWNFRSNQSLRTLNWLATEFDAKSKELINFQNNQQTLNHNALFDAWKEFGYAALEFRALRDPFTVDLSEGELECVGLNPCPIKEDGDYVDRADKIEITQFDLERLVDLGYPKALIKLFYPGMYLQSDRVSELMRPYADKQKVLYRTGTLYQMPKGVWWKF